ncbi:hypothetical protein QBC35DRAFT_381028 [Podospora australis]|uniref:BZIP domain-containing protein n=1 Tax=Podospora australis TaxID=1536484 RepID=A0AAN6WVW6_9PEZI|nr:hypothetical protein QBC35DRAFT_381028 [Podospora australis]
MVTVLAAAPANGSVDANRRTLSITTTASRDSPSPASTPASAASPTNVSTPTSSCSATAPPIAIRPGATNRPPSIKASPAINNMASPGVMSPGASLQPMALSMTSKEWVIPPRPKPGRKPATDTPPTKRKAQNRAAQRAFRERRAARVGELEEQLEEQKEEHERTVQELQERISHLEIETQTLQSRCQMLEAALEKERQGRSAVPTAWDSQPLPPAENLMQTQMQQQPSPPALSQPRRPLQPAPSKSMATSSVQIAEPRPIAQPFSISHIISPPEEPNEMMDLTTCGGCPPSGSCACADQVLQDSDLSMGCGRCSLGSNCECLEESLRSSMTMPDLKRPLPPSSPSAMAPEEKRQRSDAGLGLETDFTALFATKTSNMTLPSVTQPPAQVSLQPMMTLENCGFCEDGTFCACRDAMEAQMALAAPPPQPIAQHTQTHTPPPSEDDVVPMPMEVTATGAIKLPGPRGAQRNRPATTAQSDPPAKSSKCGPNGPGTCAQCLSDPVSGLFCRSLAANFEKNNPGSSSGGCCGGGGPGGCCKTGKTEPSPPASAPAPAPTHARMPSIADGFGVSLSCAEAYKTLASHRHFNEAADDIGSWLPKLKVLPVPRPGTNAGGQGGRDRSSGGLAPIEVEAASIMSVLKDFDVRFARGD